MSDSSTVEDRRGNQQWKPGVSANPGGRPRIEGRIRVLAQKNSRKAIKRLAALIESTNERIALAASNSILDRAIGRPAQSLALTGPQGEPLQLTTPVANAVEAARIYAQVLGGAIDANSVRFEEAALMPPPDRVNPPELPSPAQLAAPIEGEATVVASEATEPAIPKNVISMWSRLSQ